MNKYIKSLIIFVFIVVLFLCKTSLASSRQIVLKDGQSFGDISFRNEYPGKVYFKNKLLFEGGEGYDKTSPKAQIEKVSIIDLKTKYNIYACANYYCAGYLIDKNSGELKESFGQKYSYPNFLAESEDGRYFVIYYYYEDQEISDNSVSLVLVDTKNPDNDYYKYLKSGLPKNFIIDDKYKFSFEDKTGVVKGDLLDFFKQEANTNVPTNNGVINTTEVPATSNKIDFNSLGIIILPCLVALIYFVYKKFT